MTKLIIKTTDILAKTINAIPETDNYEILKYGVELFYINIYKTLILIVLALILGIWKEVLIFAVAYGFLRSFAFGIHIESSIGCTIWGLIYYIGSAYLARNIEIGLKLGTLIYIAVFFIFLCEAPSATKKRPIGKNESKNLKIISLQMLIIMYFLSLYVIGSGVIRNLLILASLCEAINIMPLTYKIFKMERGEKIYEKV